MISIIITSKNEEKTLKRAVDALLGQDIRGDDWELLVVSPDKQAQELVGGRSRKYPQIFFVKDPGEGKPAALNLAFRKARGEILVLTDGDVRVADGAINNLLNPFADEDVGAVSGRPVPVNDVNSMFGYWAHLLVNVAAHELRAQRSKKGQPLECSGYLYAVKKELVNKLPDNILAEDAYISQQVAAQGLKIKYAPGAKVYVRFPTNFSDWVRQKVRTIASYQQHYLSKKEAMRSLGKEAYHGAFRMIKEARGLKKLYWTLLLFAARFYVWLYAWYSLKVKQKSLHEIWQRVESTK